MKNNIIAVAGPTASGKTALAARLALEIGGEVISNDSMQIYQGMEIGCATPTESEMLGVPHHLLSFLSPTEDFSCADYGELAKAKAEEVIGRGKIPVFCGGTGLYLDSVITVGSLGDGEKNEALRERLTLLVEAEGPEAVHAKLRAVDPEAADAIHPNNVRRVIRAIEIFETTGVTKTEWDRRSREVEPPFRAKIIVLDFLSRELLYERIEKRVDLMLEAGLESEARALFDAGLLLETSPAYQAIGYKELIPYLQGSEDINAAADRIKQATRRYAKRQMTWFRRYKDAIVIHPDDGEGLRNFEDIVAEALEKIR